MTIEDRCLEELGDPFDPVWGAPRQLNVDPGVLVYI